VGGGRRHSLSTSSGSGRPRGPEGASSGFFVAPQKRGVWRSRKWERVISRGRVGGQWVRGAGHERCIISRRERVRLAESWLADPQKQQANPPGNSSSLTVTPCNKVNIIFLIIFINISFYIFLILESFKELESLFYSKIFGY
jgi:hypothetical protein